jgi:hypothetical protein
MTHAAECFCFQNRRSPERIADLRATPSHPIASSGELILRASLPGTSVRRILRVNVPPAG